MDVVSPAIPMQAIGMPDSDHHRRAQTASPATQNKLDMLVKSIRDTIGEAKGIADLGEDAVQRLQQLMTDYVSLKREWSDYAHWDIGRYTRNLVDDGNGHFNLLVLCWPPGVKSAIHDHPNSHCIMKILDGSMAERRFDWPEGSDQSTHHFHGSTDSLADSLSTKDENLTQVSQRVLKRDDVAYMHDQFGLHQMINASTTEPAVSLHLYSPPIAACKIFCPLTGSASQILCGKVDSRKGSRCEL